ncbi:MAG: PhzF family phenazine biosynthesis protein [Candidatus Krumholzibacteria bacterium]|nr:PhzF family phenazine biosynthesis protein [Candidatus Krumholzibacteria bacterium]
MRELTLKQIDVFSTTPFCGNPALVCSDAGGLSVEDMRRIAAEMNILESTFVSPPESIVSEYRVRSFTPSEEYDFSGHAMIATCFCLVEDGLVNLTDGVTRIAIETNAGVMPVDFHFEAGEDKYRRAGQDEVPLSSRGRAGVLRRIMINRTIREFDSVGTSPAEIASILGISEHDIVRSGLPVEIVFNGVRQLLVPVDGARAVASMSPDLIKLRLLNQRLGAKTTDVFSLDTLHEGCVSYSRHFSPAMGMWEDLGSGAGASSIAAYLLRHGVVSARAMVMEQGPEEDKLSRVHVEVKDGESGGIDVKVGGLAVTSMTRRAVIDLDTVTVT